jgi:formamidopyrimidine-DNA glycosylase
MAAVSVECPEALILARQMHGRLPGRKVASVRLRGQERLARIGFMNRDPGDYQRLVGHRVLSASARGLTILVELDGGMRLVIGPEYGGVVRLFEEAGSGEAEAARANLSLAFRNGSTLVVRLTGMGCIRAEPIWSLESNYLYRRDFLGPAADPLDKSFTLGRFRRQLAAAPRTLKAALVGKEAVVVGLGNAAFQEVAFAAGLHPKRRASELSVDEQRALFDALRRVLKERLRLGGKEGFVDLDGRPGRYRPVMGPALAGRKCPSCGARIAKVAIGGGPTYYCPRCQPAPRGEPSPRTARSARPRRSSAAPRRRA